MAVESADRTPREDLLDEIVADYLEAVEAGRTPDRAALLAGHPELAAELAASPRDCDATVVITHFGPSLRSADPRYGRQPGTASFCNADDDLLPHAALWIHGHVHCRHDYVVKHQAGHTRVVCNARGHTRRRESEGYDGLFTVEV